MTVEALFQEVNKDSPFYRRSNVGITIGGGEPTMQHDFVTAFLRRCKQSYIHTAIETCGYVSWDNMEKILEYLNLVYIDIKYTNPHAHKKLTGVSNEIILENARRISVNRPMIVRIPLIPGYNDTNDNIMDTAIFAAKLGEKSIRIELLPYHKFGTQTYSRLGREYKLANVEPPGDEEITRAKELIESYGVKVQIGG